jgi:hypothetical protein
MDDTTKQLLASLEEKLGLLKKERDYYRSVLSEMQLAHDSQTRADAIQTLIAGDKIRKGKT